MMRPLMVEGPDGEKVPHWRVRFPEYVRPAYEEFPVFLKLVWDHLGLPEPTKAQYEMAHRLQWGVDTIELEELGGYENIPEVDHHEDIIRCFRGIGKSYITATFVIWRLMRNPRDEAALVVSATGSKAKEFVAQAKGILQSMPLVMWLLDGPRDKGARRRDEADRFDVAGASNKQSYSVKAAGITGQITGSRATLIVADDIEIPDNSKTQDSREWLFHNTHEFNRIGKTEHGRADIYFLGTPQTEESMYNRLVIERGYSCFTIPIKFPPAEKLPGYKLRTDAGLEIDIIAPYLRILHDRGELKHGDLTDPDRFTIEELVEEESKGRAHYALQMMLDTSLSDAERYPLKQHDLVVFATNAVKAPLTVQWGRHSDNKNLIQDIPNVGFSGDFFIRPLFVDDEWREYEGSVLYVDPAGRGKDETAWAVVKQLGGTLYCLHVGGHNGDPDAAMLKIAMDAKRFDVNVIEVEPNYGQGIWIPAFEPVLSRVWPGGCTVQETEWAKGQKESRIIGTLEPVMASHRLVVDERIIRKDIDRVRKEGGEKKYSLMYQLTHITYDRDSLPHDDRVDALAGAVAHFTSAMAMDGRQARQAVLDQEKDEEIEEFLEMFEDGGSLSSLGFGRSLHRGRRRGKKRANSRTEVTQVTV